MVALNPVNTDPVFEKPAGYNKADQFFLKLLRDERDLPFIHFTLKIIFIIFPFAIFLFTPVLHGLWWGLAAAAYLGLLVFGFIGTFALMFHCSCHRQLFKKEYDYLNNFLPWFVAPFFGHSPETYHSHHIGMHHAENNLEEDESSTMPYKRDSFPGFLHYFGKFLFTGIYHLAMYFVRKNRKKLMVRSVRGELLFLAFCTVMCIFVNFGATMVVFVVPFVLYRLIAMLGNWAQHAFIDPSDPGNHYKNSITCINTKYNWQCWNDGYHISHHLKQAMHWSEHPTFFRNTIKDYIKNDAIVFDDADFLMVWLWLMFKRYDLLAKHFVNLDGKYKNDDEVIVFLKSRTLRIPEAVNTIAATA